MWYNSKRRDHMKARVDLEKEEKREIIRKKFEEGKSNGELAKEYKVCSRTIVRIGNKYREIGEKAFERKKKEESLIEKVNRLEQENMMLRDMQKVFNELSKKK
jgi:transposase-like protein